MRIHFPILAATLAVGCATADRVQQLEEKVASLEEQVSGLAKSGGAAAPAADAAAEAAAKDLYSEINDHMKKGETDQAKAKMGTLQSKYGSTQAFKRARKLVAELEVIGKDAPASLEVEQWFGDKADIDFAAGTTLVVFWEVWCPHCRREVPNLEKTFNTFNSQGLDMVGVTKISRSATEEKVTEFIAEQKVSYPMAKESGSLSKEFNVSGIPAAAVVKDGKIVWRGHPARLTDDMLKGWL